MANSTEFGLGASLWTQDLSKAEKLCGEIQSGVVTVNNVVASDPRFRSVESRRAELEENWAGMAFWNSQTSRRLDCTVRCAEKVAVE